MNVSVCFLFYLIGSAFCANILITNELLSPSHQIWNYALAEALAAKGHNVTLIGPKVGAAAKPSRNYHPIILEDLSESADDSVDFDPESISKWGIVQSVFVLHDYSLLSCNHSLQTKGFKSLMNYPKDFKFDVILLDMTIGHCFLPLIQRFNYPPAAGLTPFLLPPNLSGAFGNSLQPSYLPSYHTLLTNDMTFPQRLGNYLVIHFDWFVKKFYLEKHLAEMMQRAYGSNMESLPDLERRVSILLANLSPVYHHPQSLTPNIIPVGGLHIKEAQKLPKELQELMDQAKEGVILFCLGTNVRSDTIDAKKIEAILNALSKIKQTVLWKYESELANLPKNVIIRKWLPQREILAHPNLKLFISHGGALSTLEAGYFGIPIVGLPFAFDQILNIDMLVDKKIAVKVDISKLTSNIFETSIKEVLNNPSYAGNMKEISRRMKDQPQTPMELAIFWVEYLMRHDGAEFLSPRSRDMSIFVSSSLDVILFLLLSMMAIIYMFVKVIRIAMSTLLVSKKTAKKTKQKIN